MKFDSLRKIPFGIPLLGLGVATAASAAKRPVHIAIGAAWLALSAVHGMQHGEKLKEDAKKLANFRSSTKEEAKKIAKDAAWVGRNTYLHIVFAGTEVVSAFPGRVRLRNKAIIGNDELAEKLTDFVTGYAGVESAVTDLETGSMLISYDEEEIQKDAQLAAVEKYFQNHARIA